MNLDPKNILPEGAAGFVDHIGIAVRDLDEGIALYRDLLGLELERVEEVPQENVKVAFLKLDRTGALGHVELLAPMGDKGNIAAFIEKKGPGLHHVAIAAENIDKMMGRCRELGMRLLDETPRTGAGGKQIAFMHPKSGGGVLVEICSDPAH
ncbi:methylmalonyl-CoA epimerase [bacterium DOLJORAL78_65_58]|nr:MAG: methylmalonyl-CoA epimerase [bacterium DOLZORAL124_64_63]PIE76490.1 MAG: methylmalonyl-CoA epimerase [bacterium DOLJORAL78_65_58]